MTRMHVERGAKLLGLLALLGLISGCWGIWSARDDGPSTEKTRIDFELVPNAVLAKDDTTPEWQLGRYGFKPGPDELLVMTRTTSWADRDEDGKEIGPRRDRQIERAWITIPFGTAIGQELKAEELEPQFLVGYDAREANGKFYIQPSRILGTLRILEEHPTNVVMAINIIVQPADEHSAWRINSTVTVPIAPKGIHATPATAAALISHRGPAGTATAPTTQAATQPTTQPATQPATNPAAK